MISNKIISLALIGAFLSVYLNGYGYQSSYFSGIISVSNIKLGSCLGGGSGGCCKGFCKRLRKCFGCCCRCSSGGYDVSGLGGDVEPGDPQLVGVSNRAFDGNESGQQPNNDNFPPPPSDDDLPPPPPPPPPPPSDDDFPPPPPPSDDDFPPPPPSPSSSSLYESTV
ncbi:hypothetical protein FG379_000865 [Cryptosporidium bovis]|uniref:uncharacterized protein n=1 Tax=Cryptosporidium bovis TaxID=310047 RepID=UPI00351A6DD6|nr:hypothetical protein FG379_000865 [Cryptosporidium bovis]